jgi:hypothetical protein
MKERTSLELKCSQRIFVVAAVLAVLAVLSLACITTSVEQRWEPGRTDLETRYRRFDGGSDVEVRP